MYLPTKSRELDYKQQKHPSQFNWELLHQRQMENIQISILSCLLEHKAQQICGRKRKGNLKHIAYMNRKFQLINDSLRSYL
jgi:hypothetical protein